jgi:hypothetical protein
MDISLSGRDRLNRGPVRSDLCCTITGCPPLGEDSPIWSLPKAAFDNLVADIFQRYSHAFGGKGMFLKKIPPHHRQSFRQSCGLGATLKAPESPPLSRNPRPANTVFQT